MYFVIMSSLSNFRYDPTTVKHEDVSAFLCESREKFAKRSLELKIPQPLLGQKDETHILIRSSAISLMDVVLLHSSRHPQDDHMTGRNMSLTALQ
jgi:hypothetical protein